MKKVMLMSFLAAMLVLSGLSMSAANAMVFSPAESLIYGTAVALPVAAPVIIDEMASPTVLNTSARVDFAVLYNPSTLLYSYFYQLTNIDGGLQTSIGRFTFGNPMKFPVLGHGVMGDVGSDPVTLDWTATSLGANLDPRTDGTGGLAVDETTDRFFFQFSAPPTTVTGYLINDGIGSGTVVGPAPEPASMMLLGMGILGLLGLGRKKA